MKKHEGGGNNAKKGETGEARQGRDKAKGERRRGGGEATKGRRGGPDEEEEEEGPDEEEEDEDHNPTTTTTTRFNTTERHSAESRARWLCSFPLVFF